MATNFDSPEVKRKKAPTLFIELCDQRDSGWVLNGTENTRNEVRLKTPSAEFIPNRGFMLKKVGDQYENVAIRYIKNCPVLEIEEQVKRGFKPAKNRMEDLIIVKGGNFSVTREGGYISLYDYLQKVFYNGSNTDAPESSKKLFKVVEIGKKEEEFNEAEIAASEAVSFLGKLVTRKGKKEYIYNEPKINAFCNMFLVYAETPSGKLNGLIAHAKKDPAGFLDKALRFEQIITMEIGYGLELNVVRFDGNKLVYANKEKMIVDCGRGNLSQDVKIEKAADLLGSEEYKAAYEEFKIELEVAKEKQL